MIGKRRKSDTGGAVAFDSFCDSPDGRRLFDAILGQQWSEIDQIWPNMHGADRCLALDELPDDRPLSGIDQWILGSGAASCAAHTIRGAHGVARAWHARGGGRIDTVTRDGWMLFGQRLRVAERDLQKAARLDPSDVTPWLFLNTSAMGLQIPRGELDLRFEMQFRRDRTSLYGHRGYLQSIAGKWSGSNEEMWQFALDVSSAAPDGSPLHTLVADAYVERVVVSEERFAHSGLDALDRAIRLSIDHPDFANAHPVERDMTLGSFLAAAYFIEANECVARLLPLVSPTSPLKSACYVGSADDRWAELRRCNPERSDGKQSKITGFARKLVSG